MSQDKPALSASQKQSQTSLSDQLEELERLAVENGLYDAHDWIKRCKGVAPPAETEDYQPGALGTFIRAAVGVMTTLPNGGIVRTEVKLEDGRRAKLQILSAPTPRKSRKK